jgi:hypothetical protein
VSGGYPDGLSGWAYCHMEGHTGRGRCYRCGEINYRLMGWYGAVARNAKRWGVSEKEAEDRMVENAFRQEELAAARDEASQ